MSDSPAVDVIPAVPAQAPLPVFEINAVRDRLIALGYNVAGLPDGVWGDRMTAAIKALQEQAAKSNPAVVVDGIYGEQTKALLSDDANRSVVPAMRASVTANDLAAVKNPGVTGGRAITMASVISTGTAIAGFVVALQQGWTATPDIPWYAQTVMGFLPPWVPPIAIIAFNIYNVAKSRGIIDQAVQRVRQGIDNTGLPAEPAKVSLGSLFGRK